MVHECFLGLIFLPYSSAIYILAVLWDNIHDQHAEWLRENTLVVTLFHNVLFFQDTGVSYPIAFLFYSAPGGSKDLYLLSVQSE